MNEPMIKPLRLRSVGDMAAEAIIRELEHRAGGKFYIHFDHPEFGCVIYTWRYNCPCGEVSGYQGVISWWELDKMKEADIPQCVRYHVDVALECMRRHVRAEGNEPGF